MNNKNRTATKPLFITKTYEAFVSQKLKTAKKIDAAIAYITSTGILEDSIPKQHLNEVIKKSRFIVDLKQFITSPDSLEQLYKLGASIYEFHPDQNPETTQELEYKLLHSKVIGIYNSNDLIWPNTIIVGSSNLTTSAVSINLESNCALFGSEHKDEFVNFFETALEHSVKIRKTKEDVRFERPYPKRLIEYREKFEAVKKSRAKEPKLSAIIQTREKPITPFEYSFGNSVQSLLDRGYFRIKKNSPATDEEKEANRIISQAGIHFAYFKLGNRTEVEAKLNEDGSLICADLPSWTIAQYKIKRPRNWGTRNAKQKIHERIQKIWCALQFDDAEKSITIHLTKSKPLKSKLAQH